MNGNLPAGLARVVLPSLLRRALSATPVACPGKKHSIITGTPGLASAHRMSNGPALKRRRTTGLPDADEETLLTDSQVNYQA